MTGQILHHFNRFCYLKNPPKKHSQHFSFQLTKLHIRSRMDHLQSCAGSDSKRPSPFLLLPHLHNPCPPPAVQFHAFRTSFVPDDSRRLSRLTGFRGWELVLPLQPCSPAAPALIGNSPRLPSGLLSSELTCKTARLSRLSGPAGQLLAAISGLPLHMAKLFGCQCVSFWSHFRLLRI